jgi:hypothetical protein
LPDFVPVFNIPDLLDRICTKTNYHLILSAWEKDKFFTSEIKFIHQTINTRLTLREGAFTMEATFASFIICSLPINLLHMKCQSYEKSWSVGHKAKAQAHQLYSKFDKSIIFTKIQRTVLDNQAEFCSELERLEEGEFTLPDWIRWQCSTLAALPKTLLYIRKEHRLSVVSRDEEPELSLVRFLLHRRRNCTTCLLHSNNDMMLVLKFKPLIILVNVLRQKLSQNKGTYCF